ncbi:metallophosphoesterase [Marinospirillum sp. MEB164]|uniref:Metallophosphoesterase n=1 Tax=Marinospirillum alkalitolerans TaxID=3123374 RepID=A0ABW8PUD7_9GAMM
MTQVLRRLPDNTQGRDWVIGDLHGDYAALMQALEQAAFDPQRDRLFSVGDLINRGPASLECLALVKEPWFFAVQGNHERLFMQAVQGDRHALASLFEHGGRWMGLHSWEALRPWVDLIEAKMPLALEVAVAGQTFGIVHAQVPQDQWAVLTQWQGEPDAELVRACTTLRQRVREGWQHPVQGINAVACGHTLVKKPLQLGNVFALETGLCVPELDGYLTLLPISQLLAQVG